MLPRFLKKSNCIIRTMLQPTRQQKCFFSKSYFERQKIKKEMRKESNKNGNVSSEVISNSLVSTKLNEPELEITSFDLDTLTYRYCIDSLEKLLDKYSSFSADLVYLEVL